MDRRQFTKTTGLGLVGLGIARMPALASSRATQSEVQPNWDRYTVRDKDFSVLLPTTPAMTTFHVKTDPFRKIYLRHLIATYSQGVVYAIYLYDRKQSLEEFIDEFKPSYAGEYKRELKIARISGKEYAFQNDAIKVITQYFITGRYVYVFKALGSFLGNPDVGMPRFFESIKFEPTLTGLAIVDGPGEQPVAEPPKARSVDDNKALTGREVTLKMIVVTKPEPSYTEEARRNQLTGTVVLRAIFRSFGAVTDLRATSELPFGLTEKAIEAARQIKFIPAIKDGHFVSMYVQLEYNFNLY